MDVQKTIYGYIDDSIVDGRLPESFCLEDYFGNGQGVRMADGAMDGIRLYHMSRKSLPEDIVDTIAGILENAFTEDGYIDPKAEDAFVQLFEEHGAVRLAGPIYEAVLKVADHVDAGDLYGFLRYYLYMSTDKELVKLGLMLLEPFAEPTPQMKKTVRTLGACDEFTLFCVWNARRWENGNDEVFALARNARGWGRIHAIERLEPSSAEIRDWLFHEGIHNNVMPEYSALTCYVNAEVPKRLEGQMSYEDFRAASDILLALVNEISPIAGIEAFENPEAELRRYIEQAAKQQLGEDERECVDEIARYARKREWNALAAKCEALLA